ncbi:hypothetical protein DMC47_42705 [Nostoc sp. 3335mG]|nr:hypothetical protein DMC47_42705 [Nostoc sp. 3335mG]
MGPEPRLRLLIVAALAAALAAPVQAALPRAPLAPAKSKIGEDAAIARAATLAQAGDCRAVLALLDPMIAGEAGAGTPTRFSAQLLRLPCLAAAGRGGEVPTVIAELKQVSPDNPVVQGYQVFADVDAGHYAQAADTLGAIADSRSKALALMPGDLWQTLAQQLTLSGDTARRDRVALSLALADWDPSDQPQLSESIAADGVGALLDTHANDDARQMLTRIHRPALLWEMAVEHRYAPLWPEIEARLGPAGGKAIDRYARTALDAYAAAPQDPQAEVDAAQAFLALGHFEDVSSIAGTAAVAPHMADKQVDLVLTDAEALAAAGEPDKALDRLRPFTRIDFRASPQAAGALIPLAEMLDQAGRYDEELAVATQGAGETAYLSPFGLAWLQRNRVCALAGLGRTADAKAAGDALKASSRDNPAAAIEGLLCAGREDEAAAIAVSTLATAEGADALADQFQPDGALLPHSPSRLRALWAHLLTRADVKAAFDRVARIMPKPYWPQTTPRPLPAPPSGGTDDGLTTT